jgi:diguanylate cyclase (GGDEF)-like protein
VPDIAEVSDPRTRAGRQASFLFAVGGARTLVAALTSTVALRPDLLREGLADLLLAVVALLVPWRRLPRWASLLLAVPAFAVMGAALHEDLVPERAVAVPFVIVFAWAGANHGRWRSLLLLPGAALAYVLPSTGTAAGVDVRAMLITLGGCVLVAEILALAMDNLLRSNARAEHAARAFGAVARASAGLHNLDPERVLDAVADAVVDLGYDGANIAVIDASNGTFRPMHVRGIFRDVGGVPLDLSQGMTGEVWRTEQPLVVDDYQHSRWAVETIRSTGVTSTIGVPVFCRRAVVAVLYASSLRHRAIPDEEVEAMRILAATAGAALENAEQYAAERTSAAHHAAAALTDPLTGVGNRRHAHQLLDDLRPGDTLVMIDLDRFKAVNDRLGHAAGDAVLRALADHLVAGLRDSDRVARIGGEEFLVVLTGVEEDRAALTVQRLMDTWRRTQPVTTYSAGIAHHEGGSAEATLEAADQALYAAKDAGRDAWRVFTARAPMPRSAVLPR